MIVSVGVDLIEVERIQRALEDPQIGTRFRTRVFTEKEIQYCEKRQRGRAESYAARFAAKEAVMKALGVGWGKGASWREIEVVRRPGGPPTIELSGRALRTANELGVQRLSLALSHAAGIAVAFVV